MFLTWLKEPRRPIQPLPHQENKMKGFEKLQEENDEIHSKIRDKEKEYDGHKDKVTEMIDNQAKVELLTGLSGPDRLANVKQANYFGWDNINNRIEKVTKHGIFNVR